MSPVEKAALIVFALAFAVFAASVLTSRENPDEQRDPSPTSIEGTAASLRRMGRELDEINTDTEPVWTDWHSPRGGGGWRY